MKITYLGHSGFLLTGSHGQIVIDPFLTGYPFPTLQPRELKANLILISHGHADHFGDSLEIARHSDGTIVANYELVNYCADQGVNTHALHLGGSRDFNLAKVKLTIAFHGSSMGNNPAQCMGNPSGFLITMDGLNIYHAGDTALFGDMELIGRLHPIDVALLPIGDNFTMGPEDALEAVKLLKPQVAIPMHYNTWPLIAQDPQAFKTAVEAVTPTKVVIMSAKDEYQL